MASGNPFSPVINLLKGQDKDTLIYGVIVVSTFIALIAKAPPLPTICAGCAFAIIYPITQYMMAHARNEERRLELRSTLEGGASDLLRKRATEAEQNSLNELAEASAQKDKRDDPSR